MKRSLFAISLATCDPVKEIHAADEAGSLELAPYKPIKRPVFEILQLGTFQSGWSTRARIRATAPGCGRGARIPKPSCSFQ